MASIQERKNKAGRITSYRVIWRDKSGVQRSQSVKDRESAEKWKTLLEQVDHDAKAAERALVRSISQSPALYTVAAKHIGRLIVSPGMERKYKGYIKNHFDPIGNLPVDTVTDTDMIQWTKWMIARGKSPKTIRNVHGFIHGVMATAVALDEREDNPCHGRYLPADNSTEDKSTFLTMAEFNSIIQYVPEHNQLAFRFLISTGLRLGEMTALLVDDLRLDGSVPGVRVTKSWQEGATEWIVGPPKTPESRRTVSLAPSTTQALTAHTGRLQPDDQVFTARNNTTGPSHRTWQRVWNHAVTQARNNDGLRKTPRIHDLRHSHASLMIEAGMNLFDLSKRLGHKSVQTTTSVYGHLTPGAHFKAATLMEGILSGDATQELN